MISKQRHGAVLLASIWKDREPFAREFCQHVVIIKQFSLASVSEDFAMHMIYYEGMSYLRSSRFNLDDTL